jgi:hypothetical protein
MKVAGLARSAWAARLVTSATFADTAEKARRDFGLHTNHICRKTAGSARPAYHRIQRSELAFIAVRALIIFNYCGIAALEQVQT